jgi:hypothetical protein
VAVSVMWRRVVSFVGSVGRSCGLEGLPVFHIRRVLSSASVYVSVQTLTLL